MGWFESQIEERERADNEMLEQSLAAIASAISGRISAGGTDVAAHASTAVSAILKYYGVSLRGEEISTKDIEDALEGVLRKYGMMSRAVSLTDGWQHDAAGAMLGFLDDDTPVALLPRVRGGYVYLSPETGRTEHVSSQVAKRLKREAYCFYRPLPNRALRLRDLLIYMVSSLDMSDYAIVIAATAAAQLLGMVSPAVNRLVFSDAILSGSTSIIFPLASLLLSVSISSLLLGAIRSLVTNRISTKVDLPRDAALYMRTLSLPASFFGKYQTGDLSSRISAVQTVAKLMHDMVFGTLLTSVFSLAYLFQIGSYAPSLVGPSVVVVIINSVFSVVSALVQKRVTKENLKVGAKLSGWEYALISGIQKVKLAGAEKRAFATWANLYQEQARLTYNGPSILRLSGTIQTVISLVGTIVMYAAALSNNVSVSDYMGFTAAFGGITGAFTSVTSAAIQIANIRPHIDMAKPILEATPESTEDSEPVDRISGSFELDHVTFTYEGAPDPVLTDFSLKVSRGSYVAVVGETGCGKSTLVRLLLGFEKPQRGAVCYDGRDLSRLNMRDVRRNIGVVLQDGKLLRGSIYDNIAISAPGLSLDDAWHAAELAGFADDVKAMPMGMQTLISEGGGGLSGGQKQRLMIARAVAGNPKLLIFDEATSALDNITQRKVSESLDALNCTRLVIAHRLSTIKNCDRIVLIEHGRIAEDGTFEELMELNGAFADLVARQQV